MSIFASIMWLSNSPSLLTIDLRLVNDIVGSLSVSVSSAGFVGMARMIGVVLRLLRFSLLFFWYLEFRCFRCFALAYERRFR